MEQSLDKILSDNHSGSATLARNMLEYFKEILHECSKSETDLDTCFTNLNEESKLIIKSQPNMALLRKTNTLFLSHFKRALQSENSEIIPTSLKKIEELQQRISENLKQIAVSGSKLIANSNKLMTISHSANVREIILNAHKKKKRFEIYCLKSHPPDEGVQLAEILSKENIQTTLIADSEMGVFMPELNGVIVGADRLYKDGFVNKAGTLPLVLTARYFKVPVYLAVETWKILSEKEKALKFVERSTDEVYKNRNSELNVQNIYYERVPLEMISKVICEEGVFDRDEFVDWYLEDI